MIACVRLYVFMTVEHTCRVKLGPSLSFIISKEVLVGLRYTLVELEHVPLVAGECLNNTSAESSQGVHVQAEQLGKRH